jgi:hypothetical protein
MTSKTMDVREILMLPMERNDAGAKTIGEFIALLGAKLFEEEEGFSGKRPFGNSDWITDAYIPLIKAGLIDGEFDEHGYLESVNWDAGAEIFSRIFTFLKELDYRTIP